ncbi:MAG: lipopolysaccharide heptosyltransferase family protein [Ignavibacteriaceae bacterium]|nr:lipopolysaccharide heptosyltransferase family protein [Ignavibacteriaceae bacterium]
MDKLRIIISRPDRIGDVVLSTFMPREIKRTFPNSYVCMLVKNHTKTLYINNPFVDKLIAVDDFDSSFSLVLEIRKQKFNYSVMLLPTEKVNWVFFAAGIKNRIGVGHKFYQFITNAKSTYRRKYIPLRHEAEYCADSLRKIGIIPQSINPEIYFSLEERNEIENIKKKYGSGSAYLIGINSTSGGSAPNLSPSEYRKLVLKLSSIAEVKVLVMDMQPAEELSSLEGIEYPCLNLPLRNAMVQFAALDLLIAPSTGPMHIAAAAKVKTLALFCSTPACSPTLWGPLGNESKIILPEAGYCRSVCHGDAQKCDFSGEGGIDADRIEKAVIDMLPNLK